MTDKEIQKIKISTIQSLIDSMIEGGHKQLTLNDMNAIKKALIEMSS